MDQDIVDAIGSGNLSKIKLTPKDQALLKFVKQLTLNSSHMQDSDVQEMRDVGWTDEQIWEAALEVGMFSLLNRMADVYGLDYPSSGWFPPAMREQMEREKQEKQEKEKGVKAAPDPR